MSQTGRFVATMVLAILVGALGALVGAGLAALASPLTPIGLARRAEPDPGLALNLAGLSIGIAATLVLIGGLAAVPAWRLARTTPDAPGPTARTGASSTVADAAAQAGLPPSSVTGLRMALEQGGARTRCRCARPSSASPPGSSPSLPHSRSLSV